MGTYASSARGACAGWVRLRHACMPSGRRGCGRVQLSGPPSRANSRFSKVGVGKGGARQCCMGTGRRRDPRASLRNGLDGPEYASARARRARLRAGARQPAVACVVRHGGRTAPTASSERASPWRPACCASGSCNQRGFSICACAATVWGTSGELGSKSSIGQNINGGSSACAKREKLGQ